MKIKKVVNVPVGDSWRKIPVSLRLTSEDLVIECSTLKVPNISSHALVDLNSTNQFNSPGKALLNLFGILEKEDIDPYQTFKGAVGELFATDWLLQRFPGSKVQSFQTTDFVGFNQFRLVPPFSGAVDKVLHTDGLQIVIECKTKEAAKKNFILGSLPESEVMQGMQLAFLYNQQYQTQTPYYYMLYIFINPTTAEFLAEQVDTIQVLAQEGEGVMTLKEICEQLGVSVKDFEFHLIRKEINLPLLQTYQRKAKALVDRVQQKRTISLALFNRNELEELYQHCGEIK